MRQATADQMLRVRAELAARIVREHGIMMDGRIGGKVSVERAIQEQVVINIIGFAVDQSGTEMGLKYAELGDMNLVWAHYLKELFGEEPEGDDIPRIVPATPADAQDAIKAAAMFREAREGKPHA